ncbi:MAG: hypothetical protein EOO01_03380 [Chitinophagaceae bacterium]|nr:MAG: hypothetical protein EOO01_03380 [Chitinophagaceae bacterium]
MKHKISMLPLRANFEKKMACSVGLNDFRLEDLACLAEQFSFESALWYIYLSGKLSTRSCHHSWHLIADQLQASTSANQELWVLQIGLATCSSHTSTCEELANTAEAAADPYSVVFCSLLVLVFVAGMIKVLFDRRK